MLKIHKFMFLADKLLDRELQINFEVSFSQFRVLAVICKNPGISQKHIALIQETTQAAVSRHIDILNKRKYVALTTNSNNRKEHNLHLTKNGKDLFSKALTFVEKESDSLLNKVGEKKKLELGKMFDILVDAVRKEYGEDPHCKL